MNSSFRSGSGPKSTQLLRDICLGPGALWIQRIAFESFAFAFPSHSPTKRLGLVDSDNRDPENGQS